MIGIIHTGCDDKHRFVCKLDSNNVEKLVITYAQRGKIVVQKPLEACTLENNILTVPLTQEETLLFDSGVIAEVQARAKLTDGTATKSRIVSAFPDELLNKEVL